MQRSGAAHREDEQLTPDSRAAKLAAIGSINGSPRTQLPSFTKLTSGVAPEERLSEDDGESQAKRRRVEGLDGSRPSTRESGRDFSSPHQEYEEEEERLYRRELRQQEIRRGNGGNQQVSPRHDRELSEGHASMGAPHHSASMTDARNIALIEDGYDSNVPLARRRGDVAQAKAGRLHIETGSVDTGVVGGGSGLVGGYESNLARFKTISSSNVGSIGAKSAPHYKMSFTDRDRDGIPFDVRGESSSQPHHASRTYTNGSGAVVAGQGYQPSGAYTTRREIPSQELHNFNDANNTASNRRGEQYAPTSSQQQGGILHRQVGSTSTANTPLTAVRGNIFVPQTATLPSPAYHTTQFMRNPMGGNANGGVVHGHQGGDPRGMATPSTSHPGGGAANLAGPPKTAGLNPPMTARLPEHLRSPPSSKTQFLALFSNFYDSLTDSRTLKATLEDQVRRSNTLLQTLQKSSRVLELTVDRRVREERVLWESKMRSLEERCNRLEKKLGGVEGEEIAAEAEPMASIEAGEASVTTSRESNAFIRKSLREEGGERHGSPKNGSVKGAGSVNGSEPHDEAMAEAE